MPMQGLIFRRTARATMDKGPVASLSKDRVGGLLRCGYTLCPGASGRSSECAG
jgi:hypothetical protein